jgi:hypothetical protein
MTVLIDKKIINIAFVIPFLNISSLLKRSQPSAAPTWAGVHIVGAAEGSDLLILL